jgi:hypothetical protein
MELGMVTFTNFKLKLQQQWMIHNMLIFMILQIHLLSADKLSQHLLNFLTIINAQVLWKILLIQLLWFKTVQLSFYLKVNGVSL